MHPVTDHYDEKADWPLIRLACAGSRPALEKLVLLHQRFIYDVAYKLARDANDAADITQEVLIKMLTKLVQFQFKCSFRTWLYRMVVNHFLNSKRKMETRPFAFFEELEGDCAGDEAERVADVRNRCMLSILLCLDRRQRTVLVLGSVFNLKSAVAAGLLNITPGNFRKQLSRAKEDMFQFMDKRCGLVNPANPCRCQKKTQGFIREGKVDPVTHRFTREAREGIVDQVGLKNRQLDQLMQGRYLRLFSRRRETDAAAEDQLIESLLMDPDVRNLFLLD